MNNSCIFANRIINDKGDLGCQACKQYQCHDCPFYKSKDEYEMYTYVSLIYGVVKGCVGKKNGK